MKEIPLTQNQVALVDDEDYNELVKYKWQARLVKKTGNYYACRSGKKVDGKRPQIRMHCAILGIIGVDHRDSNGLNNQRYNLRPASQLGNARNASKSKAKLTSKYKGVCIRNETKTLAYRAQITVNYKKIMLGTFHNEIEAAKVYDAAALKYFGEFAKLNFPLDNLENI